MHPSFYTDYFTGAPLYKESAAIAFQELSNLHIQEEHSQDYESDEEYG